MFIVFESGLSTERRKASFLAEEGCRRNLFQNLLFPACCPTFCAAFASFFSVSPFVSRVTATDILFDLFGVSGER